MTNTFEPWPIEYDNNNQGGQWYSVGPAVIYFSRRQGAGEQAKADADLISIAPVLRALNAELLAALEGALVFLDRVDVLDQFSGRAGYHFVSEARAVIAKARELEL